MIQGLLIEEGQYGQRAIPIGKWSDKMTDYVVEQGIAELELNQGKGWSGDDVSFLADLPNLLGVEILKLNLSSVEPIHSLNKLRLLKISTYCRTEIRFSSFPSLEICSLEWRPKAVSVFDCTTLRSLFINRYTGKDTANFRRLANLESLALLNAPIENLDGLSHLYRLTTLRLANLRKLGSLKGINQLVNLMTLKIEACRSINSLNEIALLIKLTTLTLDDCGKIETLKHLRNLSKLELFSFSESTDIVDGRLDVLDELPNLQRVAFRDRSTYSLRWKDVAQKSEGRDVKRRSPTDS